MTETKPSRNSHEQIIEENKHDRKRDTFDYTEWQRKLWSDKSIEEIHALATEHEKMNKKKGKTP